MNYQGFRLELPEGRSEWVAELLFNGEALTVVTHQGKSFDLLAISPAESEAVRNAFLSGASVGRAINQLTAIRNNDGTLKTEAVPAHVWA